MKRKITQQQMDNLLEARDVMWPSVPPRNVIDGLIDWRSGRAFSDKGGPASCGTVACLGGWCAVYPAFVAQGVRVMPNGGPEVYGATGFEAGEHLFGDVLLFQSRGLHVADRDFTGTDHELVTNRLNWAIANSEVA